MVRPPLRVRERGAYRGAPPRSGAAICRRSHVLLRIRSAWRSHRRALLPARRYRGRRRRRLAEARRGHRQRVRPRRARRGRQRVNGKRSRLTISDKGKSTRSPRSARARTVADEESVATVTFFRLPPGSVRPPSHPSRRPPRRSRLASQQEISNNRFAAGSTASSSTERCQTPHGAGVRMRGDKSPFLCTLVGATPGICVVRSHVRGRQHPAESQSSLWRRVGLRGRLMRRGHFVTGRGTPASPGRLPERKQREHVSARLFEGVQQGVDAQVTLQFPFTRR